MIDTMPSHTPLPLLRAFPQAPWRTQTQRMATVAVILLVVMVMGGLYLQVASRAATAGRDVQFLESRKAELVLENNQLRSELAELRSVTRLAERAKALGFQPALPEQIEYLKVESYPHQAQTTALPRAEVPEAPPSELAQVLDWLTHVLQGPRTSSAEG